jgi:hypothetical protein
MVKRKADLVDNKGAVVAVFNETCHDYGSTVATVRLRKPLAPYCCPQSRALRRGLRKTSYLQRDGHARSGASAGRAAGET